MSLVSLGKWSKKLSNIVSPYKLNKKFIQPIFINWMNML